MKAEFSSFTKPLSKFSFVIIMADETTDAAKVNLKKDLGGKKEFLGLYMVSSYDVARPLQLLLSSKHTDVGNLDQTELTPNSHEFCSHRRNTEKY